MRFHLKNNTSYVVALTQASEASREAILFLHGFPANLGNKNFDVATAVHQKTGSDVFLIHYRGLGESPGAFSFSDSVQESMTLAKELVQQRGYEKLHLVGHSWGGLIALNILKSLGKTQGKTILLSPLSHFPDQETSAAIITSIKADLPKIFGSKTNNEVLADLAKAEAQFGPLNLVHEVDGKSVLIVQARHDDEVPPAATKVLMSKFKESPKYIELDQGHSFFESRHELITTIISEF